MSLQRLVSCGLVASSRSAETRFRLDLLGLLGGILGPQRERERARVVLLRHNSTLEPLRRFVALDLDERLSQDLSKCIVYH